MKQENASLNELKNTLSGFKITESLRILSAEKPTDPLDVSSNTELANQIKRLQTLNDKIAELEIQLKPMKEEAESLLEGRRDEQGNLLIAGIAQKLEELKAGLVRVENAVYSFISKPNKGRYKYKEAFTLALTKVNADTQNVINKALEDTKGADTTSYKFKKEYEVGKEEAKPVKKTKTGSVVTSDAEDVVVYDAGDKLGDRYTVFIGNSVYGMGDRPLSPDGFNQYVGERSEGYKEGKHLGKKVNVDDLPEAVQKAIMNRKGSKRLSYKSDKPEPTYRLGDEVIVNEDGRKGHVVFIDHSHQGTMITVMMDPIKSEEEHEEEFRPEELVKQMSLFDPLQADFEAMDMVKDQGDKPLKDFDPAQADIEAQGSKKTASKNKEVTGYKKFATEDKGYPIWLGNNKERMEKAYETYQQKAKEVNYDNMLSFQDFCKREYEAGY